MSFTYQRLRYGRYDEIVVSPHLDDAAFSCGGRIAQRVRSGKKVLVVTLFGTGGELDIGGGDRRFSDYETRWREERAALEHLGADYVWLNAPELMFRPLGLRQKLRLLFPFLPMAPAPLVSRLRDQLQALCEQRLAPGGTVLFPLAVGFHPDHRIAFEIGRDLHAQGLFAVEFYEDAYYAAHGTLLELRLAYLGMPRKPGLVATARELGCIYAKDAGILRWPCLLFAWLYVAAVFAACAVCGGVEKLAHAQQPRRISRCIADAVDAKVAALRLYPSQAVHFFPLDDRVYDALRCEGAFQEHSWTFPSPAPAVAAEGAEPRPASSAVGLELGEGSSA